SRSHPTGPGLGSHDRSPACRFRFLRQPETWRTFRGVQPRRPAGGHRERRRESPDLGHGPRRPAGRGPRRPRATPERSLDRRGGRGGPAPGRRTRPAVGRPAGPVPRRLRGHPGPGPGVAGAGDPRLPAGGGRRRRRDPPPSAGGPGPPRPRPPPPPRPGSPWARPRPVAGSPVSGIGAGSRPSAGGFDGPDDKPPTADPVHRDREERLEWYEDVGKSGLTDTVTPGPQNYDIRLGR